MAVDSLEGGGPTSATAGFFRDPDFWQTRDENWTDDKKGAAIANQTKEQRTTEAKVVEGASGHVSTSRTSAAATSSSADANKQQLYAGPDGAVALGKNAWATTDQFREDPYHWRVNFNGASVQTTEGYYKWVVWTPLGGRKSGSSPGPFGRYSNG